MVELLYPIQHLRICQLFPASLLHDLRKEGI